MISWTADNWAKVFVDGQAIDESGSWTELKQTFIYENASVVAFEIHANDGNKGFVASYDSIVTAWASDDNDYWRCTDDSALITSNWNSEGNFRILYV